MTSDSRERLQELIDRQLREIPTPRILEAGCGSVTNISLPPGNHITGIDISERELEANQSLSERIVADLQSYNFTPDQFDLIVCWDVLEHLPFPERALERFAVALKPGGLLLIQVPNRNSVKALVVRFTPYWFHRLVYKGLYGRRFGTPGVIPFRTFFRPSIAPRELAAFAARNDLQPEFIKTEESKIQRRFREKLGIGYRLTNITERFVQTLSFGKLTLVHSECTCVYRKKIASVLTPA